MNKTDARRHGEAARARLGPDERRHAADTLARALPHHPLLTARPPGNVLVPSHHRNEIDTTPLAVHLERLGWPIHRPRTLETRTTLEAVAWPTERPLVAGYAGIPEPPADAAAADPTTLALVLVPGAAFAADGARVGTGWGYFDRFLAPLVQARPRPLVVGIGYRVQLVPGIMAEPHDIPMDGLQLEDLAVECRSGR